MNNKQHIIALSLVFTFSTAGYAANPATKEYVDAQVTILQSQIAAIPAGKQGPAGPQGDTGPQGPLCNNAENATCYADWYLPSNFELRQLFFKGNTYGSVVDGFVATNYWSSTELSTNQASGVNFSNGSDVTAAKSIPLRVRCIRAF